MSDAARRRAVTLELLDALDALDWKSFWDLATPEEAATLMRDLYGIGAAAATASAAADALADGRDEDARFWVAARAAIRRQPVH